MKPHLTYKKLCMEKKYSYIDRKGYFFNEKKNFKTKKLTNMNHD